MLREDRGGLSNPAWRAGGTVFCRTLHVRLCKVLAKSTGQEDLSSTRSQLALSS